MCRIKQNSMVFDHFSMGCSFSGIHCIMLIKLAELCFHPAPNFTGFFYDKIDNITWKETSRFWTRSCLSCPDYAWICWRSLQWLLSSFCFLLSACFEPSAKCNWCPKCNECFDIFWDGLFNVLFSENEFNSSLELSELFLQLFLAYLQVLHLGQERVLWAIAGDITAAISEAIGGIHLAEYSAGTKLCRMGCKCYHTRFVTYASILQKLSAPGDTMWSVQPRFPTKSGMTGVTSTLFS